MTTTLWDTNGGDIMRALSAERRAGGAVASGLAVTFITVVDDKNIGDAERAAMIASQAHPCRLLMVIRRQVETADRLDAEVQVGGRLGPIEAVVMRMYGRLTLHAESVVLPLLAPDAPVVTWWHGAPPDHIATDPLGVLASRRITDCALASDPMAALRCRAQDYAPGDTDLAWTRATPWRSLLASALDASAATVLAARVAAEEHNPTAALLAGWISARLAIPSEIVTSPGPGVTGVELTISEDGEEQTLGIDRPDGHLATFSRAGRPARELPLPRRELGELLSEELRRLEVDDIYGEALSYATAVAGLGDRPPRRTHIWRDPALSEAAR
ncbi:MAG: glucose-6-phosphate dehydrogenase assembly protein OpcA [Acidimicrobiales bacterium]